MFFKKSEKKKAERVYKGMPVGVRKGPIFGSVLDYYCPNCYYGLKDFEKLKCDMDKCPNCGVKLNFEK